VNCKPLVSICLPNLNTRPYLAERMETILAQTLTDWELIVCDSYSDDGAWEFFQQFKNDPRIHLHQVPRQGVFAGWNECLKRVRGELIYFATSDDTMQPDLLEKLAHLLAVHPDVDQVTCNLQIIDAASRPLGRAQFCDQWIGDWLTKNHRRCGLTEFVAGCVGFATCLSLTALLFRRSLLDKVGFFPEDRAGIGDYEWCLRTYLHTDTIHLAEELATWRQHDRQVTFNRDEARLNPLFIAMIEAVLKFGQDRLPAQLRTSAARARVVHPKQVLAYNSQQLATRLFLTHPGLALARLRAAWRISPAVTLAHALRGFGWRYRPQLERGEYLETLIRDLSLPPLCRALDPVPAAA